MNTMKHGREVVSMKRIHNEILGFGDVVRETETHIYARFYSDPWMIYTFSKDAKNFKIIS
jgi:hypothetical protein